MWLEGMSKELRRWLGEQVPFSFRFGGVASSDWLAGCQVTRQSSPIDEARAGHTVVYEDPDTGLRVTCEAIVFTDVPAAEWLLHFENTGTAGLPVLEEIHALDVTLPLPDRSRQFTLHGARGGLNAPTDYEPLRFDLGPDDRAELSAGGGRSSNRHLPFFNVDAGEEGVAAGVGWSGQWQADFQTDAEGALHVQADIARTHLVLHPGERIRTARVLLVPWQGDRFAGHNALRQLIYRYHTPLLAGEKPLPPTQCNTWFPVGDDGGKANAQNQIELLRAYQPTGIEYMVMDAGWYGRTPIWWENVGTWAPRPDTFPNGIEPVGEVAREVGIQFGMWFEPERVQPGTELDRNHPEWLIEIEGQENRLLNLGLRDVQEWFIALISSYVESVPLGYFRHDFNMDPLLYWQSADAPDRIGMAEIRYIEGLYRIWDTIHARYPDLLMEGCSSGGRRIDLESISRCHTYWKTDLYGNIVANQGHTYGANLYLPGNYLNTPLFDLSDDPYAFRSQLGCALCLGWDPRQDGFDLERARARVEAFKARRHLFVGDFYPLTDYSIQATDWIGYQFHREDLGEGLALFFRREDSDRATLEFSLRGLAADVVYELRFEDSDESRVASGEELSQPMQVTIERAPGSAMILYRLLS